MNKQHGFTLPEILALAWILLIIVFFIGWCINLYTVIVQLAADHPVTGMIIARIIGVFLAPLGGFLGVFF